MVQCTIKKNMLYRLRTSLTFWTFLSPTPITMLTQLLKSPWVPEQNSKIYLEMVSFANFKLLQPTNSLGPSQTPQTLYYNELL